MLFLYKHTYYLENLSSCLLNLAASDFLVYLVFYFGVFLSGASQTIPGMESFAETAASLRGLPQMVGPFSLYFAQIDNIS